MSDQDKDIDALKDELERERMRLAACGVVAMSNTRETAKENREVSDEYKSSSFDQVCAAVDREMALRERVAELEAQNHALKRQRDEAVNLYTDLLRRLSVSTPPRHAFLSGDASEKEGGGA